MTMALFSDGAAAAIVRLAEGASGDALVDDASVTIVARHSTIVPDSLDVMGFDATDEGLHWRLAPDVPDVALTWTRASVEDALADRGLEAGRPRSRAGPSGWHQGARRGRTGRRLGPGHLEWSRNAMREHGNVSSVTVLLVLEEFMASAPVPGRGLVTAMGPGFAFEHVLFTVGPGFAPG